MTFSHANANGFWRSMTICDHGCMQEEMLLMRALEPRRCCCLSNWKKGKRVKGTFGDYALMV